ncbi:MAG: MarR family transcriptional regulator [Saprospiraceae bacterium]|nr:MarR family transcriptional regulator [Saprospiraceae bacterium]
MQVINPQQTVFYSIEKAIKTYRQFAQRCISNEGIDITIDQLLVLRAIVDYEGISQSQIGEMIFKDYASVTRMIDLLVKKGYLHRAYHQEDRRRHALNITTQGQEVIERLNPIVSEYRSTALHNVHENEVNLVRKVLKKLIENCTNGKI